MTEPAVTLDTLSLELESILRKHCDERKADFAKMRKVLISKWFSGQPDILSERERLILDKAYRYQLKGDTLGFRSVCLEWLKNVRGLQIGDIVRLGRGPEAPAVLIEDFKLDLDECNLRLSSTIFIGRCLSGRSGGRQRLEYSQFLSDPTEKVMH